MDHLGGLELFVQVAKAGSFVEAARLAAISPSAVSKGIARLEARLQVRLLNRSTRSIALTEEGIRFYRNSVAILRAVQDAENQLRQIREYPRGKLKISLAEESMAAPFLADFALAWPEIDIELDFSDRMVNVIEESFDVVIRSGHIADSRLAARKLATFGSKVVASPDYLARAGIPQTPQDLERHACLHYRFPHNGKLEPWQLRGIESIAGALPATLICNNSQGRLDFALRGVGLAWLPNYVVRCALADGSLVSVLDEYAIRTESLWLLWPSGPYLPLKTRLFIDYLCDRFADKTTADSAE
ncbi:LysR family transcriptional regulator [Martelella alba]|uniref:LysR family transcriptional regulator n=1 Tax=Martelella alba TaxID=2590451 RepID=A0ABY2SHH6_9HYPH|nr:LysR family transcriptional regulator [Martelella alba]TKI04489.1 LysR family transcriptional regulator [Martelella alba]